MIRVKIYISILLFDEKHIKLSFEKSLFFILCHVIFDFTNYYEIHSLINYILNYRISNI
jgi:hypothetical protein